jgi:hypothetical protein
VELARRHRIPSLVIVATLAFYVWVSVQHLHRPGLHYDEVFWVNAALGGLNDVFIHRRLFGVPVMLMEYIGALKAYLYFPIFKVFGVSVESIRLPAILLTLGAIALFVALVARQFGLKWAALLAILLATDPAIIFHARLDWGPIVIATLFKALTLYCFFTFIERPTTRHLWAIVALTVLGTFDKLNYIWFAGAFIVSATLFYHKELRHAMGLLKQKVILPLAAFSFAMSLFALYIASLWSLPTNPSVSRPLDLAQRLVETANLYLTTMRGERLHYVLFPSMEASASLANVGLSLFVSALALTWVFCAVTKRLHETEFPKVCLFYLAILGTMTVQIVLTRQATGSHHAMALWPFNHLAMVAAAYFVANNVRPSLRTAGTVLAATLIGVVAISQYRVDLHYLNAFQNHRGYSTFWSPGINTLSASLTETAPAIDGIYSCDWGIHNQLFTLSPAGLRHKLFDFWPTFTADRNEQNYNWLYRSHFRGKDVLVILHPKELSAFPATNANFFKFAKEYNLSTERVRFGGGVDMYEIYRVKGTGG